MRMFGATDEQGHYYLGTYEINDGAIVGKHRVAVVKRRPNRSLPGGPPGGGMEALFWPACR